VVPVAFFLIAGALLASHDDETEDEVEAEPGRFARLAPRIGLAVVSLIALAAIAIPLAGAEELSQSQTEVNGGNLDAALSDARTARDIQPYSGAATLQEALVLELQGDLDGAATVAQTATEQESQNWENWAVLSRIQAERGDVQGAIDAYKQAKALDPTSPLFAQ